jgi:hypothetical protein
MIKLILFLLDKFPYRTKFGLSISDLLKIKYNKTHPYDCLCGGKIITLPYSSYHGGDDIDIGYEIRCNTCKFLYDED